MVRTSGIREKLRSNVLKDLARERSQKRTRTHKDPTDSQSEDSESDHDESEKSIKKHKGSSSSLLSMLPEPKNSSAFGPTVNLNKLLKLPSKAEAITNKSEESDVRRISEDGMVEVDIAKVVAESQPSTLKDLTIERETSSSVILPKGKEKQKNQITYLAKLSKATEIERKEQAAQGRANKAAARSKYGW